MTTGTEYCRTLHLPSEAATEAFAREVSLFVRTGDVITLAGELGTGKTTFARAFIRAMSAANGEPEVPSPTFTLVQTYEETRLPVAHFDFYRVADPEEVPELGFPGLADTMVVLAEWPDRADAFMPADRLEITLSDGDSAESRGLTLIGHGDWALRAARMEVISAFLDAGGYHGCTRAFLQGDASARRYERIWPAGKSTAPRILMDSAHTADGPPVRNGLPYSQIAHLAENVTAFAAIDQGLRGIGLCAPEIFASDLEAGLLIIEDLGGEVYQDMVCSKKADMTAPYAAAVDVLVKLAQSPLNEIITLPGGVEHRVPKFDEGALEIEVELLLDWYWPAVHEGAPPGEVRERFFAIWRGLWPRLDWHQTVWCLRDYHSPNLIWRAEETGLARVGIIDFQDTVQGHPAYDLASLLLDARVDVDQETERRMLEYYVEQRRRADENFDQSAFAECYAILAAQRLTKILGIFMRLKERDGKPGYLQHIPRLWRYLDQTLQAPVLKDLRIWYEEAFPAAARRTDQAV
ncbi:MAG: tRNA (adenosine(37)-N6)-threonylcarbamoyltransferase complex ATPase subunit type 1 TsaE [Rhizobiales bacterium]|nr:tRNA (adenosine(37)-N6)-threonylcarbamoyltransferase complex ATPase subunit type 1 TsaE [Hyphomicrobiales bacterium]